MSSAGAKPRDVSDSKYEKRVKLNATAEQIAQTVFMGRPKPKSEWRYLKKGKRD